MELFIKKPAGRFDAEYEILRHSESVTPPVFIVIVHVLSLTVISASAANAPPAIGAGSAAATITLRIFVLVFHLASVAV